MGEREKKMRNKVRGEAAGGKKERDGRGREGGEEHTRLEREISHPRLWVCCS
jgi:hypothetical protein